VGPHARAADWRAWTHAPSVTLKLILQGARPSPGRAKKGKSTTGPRDQHPRLRYGPRPCAVSPEMSSRYRRNRPLGSGVTRHACKVFPNQQAGGAFRVGQGWPLMCTDSLSRQGHCPRHCRGGRTSSQWRAPLLGVTRRNPGICPGRNQLRGAPEQGFASGRRSRAISKGRTEKE